MQFQIDACLFVDMPYIKKESPNTYDDIVNVIKNIIKTKINKIHLENYLKHSFKIYN